ncbi:MAG: tryptophan 7-halogenase [Verrucomicrobiota bacterium]|jgi:hypothetical protein|nr:tryptophan 7-halogenase [Verrucomicrobiota bacterium]
MDADLYDVAIIGGGPAGSIAATLLAQAGRRVVVFEREKFPRFHIGESLLPFSMKAFTRLGLHEKFRRAGFLKKFGGEIFGACSEPGTKFYFKDGFRSQRAVNRAMDIYLRFVNAWYTKEFVEVFLSPRNVLGVAPAVNAVLGGNVGNSFGIRWRM